MIDYLWGAPFVRDSGDLLDVVAADDQLAGLVPSGAADIPVEVHVDELGAWHLEQTCWHHRAASSASAPVPLEAWLRHPSRAVCAEDATITTFPFAHRGPLTALLAAVTLASVLRRLDEPSEIDATVPILDGVLLAFGRAADDRTHAALADRVLAAARHRVARRCAVELAEELAQKPAGLPSSVGGTVAAPIVSSFGVSYHAVRAVVAWPEVVITDSFSHVAFDVADDAAFVAELVRGAAAPVRLGDRSTVATALALWEASRTGRRDPGGAEWSRAVDSARLLVADRPAS